ncbi:MAG TPA: pentapeptide repeat-containing protein, partial [Acetobacteraceae bacterium]|nr:pentapeptide repeat-containing protein [Acetobacteraceae bacterium]
MTAPSAPPPGVARRALRALLVVAGLLAAGPAAAGCTDAARPDVDWRRCLLDQRDLRGADLTGARLRDTSLSRA